MSDPVTLRFLIPFLAKNNSEINQIIIFIDLGSFCFSPKNVLGLGFELGSTSLKEMVQ